MLYDLNIAWSPSTSAAELERTLRFSASLGYDVVALNHTINSPVPTQITNPLPKFPAPGTATFKSTSTTPSTSISNNAPTAPTTTNPPTTPKLPTVLHRATLTLSDSSGNHRLPQLASAYDIFAVRPTTEPAFTAACLNMAEASLISLDMTARFPFHFRPKPCMAAVGRGVRFEICYGQVLQQQPGSPATDARARSTFVGNVVQLVRATRGRGIVLSSEARGVLGVRAPADVVNLLSVWGLPTDRGVAGLGAVARGVVVNEGIRRSGFRGVVDIVGVAEKKGGGEEDVMMDGDDDGRRGGGAGVAKGGNDNKKGKGKNNNNNNNNAAARDGKKRKNGEGVETAAGGGNGEGEGEGEGDEQPLVSKRQAKKMKAALRKKQADEQQTT